MGKNPLKTLVVGASRGIGAEFVRQSIAAGGQVTATARTAQALSVLKAMGANALELDVLDEARIQALASNVGGGFEQVIINAGVFGPRTAPLEPPSSDDFNTVMRTNVLGPMRVIAQLHSALAAGGKLAVISSRMGSIGLRENGGASLYRASKAALNSVLKDTAITLGAGAICVAFHPGWVRTDMGGAGADIAVDESVGGMLKVLATLKPADTGSFFNCDGTPLAW